MLQMVTPVVRLPEAPTPEVSYPGMLLSAISVVGVVLVAALVVGLLVGGLFIWRKRAARQDGGREDDMCVLDLSSPSQ